jgi:hypothetical protein
VIGALRGTYAEVGTFGAASYSQQSWLALTQLASVTWLIGITFVMSRFASVANYVWEGADRRS